MRPVRTPTRDDLDRAVDVVATHLGPTPLDRGVGDSDEPLLKLESLQPTGSFKVRGALNALSAVAPDVPVVTASAGNHGLGMAYAARLLGRQASVVVSTKASPAKVDALRRLGTDPVQVGESYEDAEAHAFELADQGARYVSPYNDPDVIAGQGTIGVELAEQLPGPMTVVCSIGGGGLASGIGLWASARSDVRVVGVESELSMAVSAAVRAGEWVEIDVGETIADGLGGNIERGSVTVDVVGKHVDELVAVSEAEIAEAMRWLVSRRGVVAEGAGAASVAAVLAGKVGGNGPTVAVVSGRNITVPTLVAQLG